MSESIVLKGLSSGKSNERLNQIDRVRALGISDHISLPQLVVCGDQSSGKSSVLEGLTGIPFPRQDGLCTRFATEIILRHSSDSLRILATVIPGATRSDAQKKRFQNYSRVLKDFTELPDVIKQTSELMDIRQPGQCSEKPAFANDILRIEVSGMTGLHLTVVDLPGLVAVVNEDQTLEDVQTVKDLVDSYLKSPRTIILSVVQANNDIANQGIIQRAKIFDEKGQRTVGIITKPDLINEGTESRIARLAKNQDTTKLKLGFFLIKSPTPAQLLAGIGYDERVRAETQFFQQAKWKKEGLDAKRVGIEALKTYLQELLADHIERELPYVLKEIQTLLDEVRTELAELGEERSNVLQVRSYLTRLSMTYHRIARAALDGDYHADVKFFQHSKEEEFWTRLRAQIHDENEEFARFMRNKGEKFVLPVNKKAASKKGIISAAPITREVTLHSAPSPGLCSMPVPCAASSSLTSSDGDDYEDGSLDDVIYDYNRFGILDPVRMSREEVYDWVEDVRRRTRGRELPGTCNFMLLTELFHEQSSRWGDIAKSHVAIIVKMSRAFVYRVLKFIVTESAVRSEIEKRVDNSFEAMETEAFAELRKIVVDDTCHPITYNKCYVDNIETARKDEMNKSIDQAFTKATSSMFKRNMLNEEHIRFTREDAENMLAILQRDIVDSTDHRVCEETLTNLKAYYKVSINTFIDNVCRQVVERRILAHLADLFGPVVVVNLPDDELVRIAAEPKFKKLRRHELYTLEATLTSSIAELR